MSQSDIINSRQIQWFPGHMTKTLRLMEKEIRNVDCVLQILDARIPLSSLNHGRKAPCIYPEQSRFGGPGYHKAVVGVL